MEGFVRLLDRSSEFADYLARALASAQGFAAGDRPEASLAAADLSFEHAHSLRVLFEVGNPSSASAMLRLQYESLLRAAWVLYAANETQLSKLTAPLAAESSAAAKNSRSADDMLKDLEQTLATTPTLRGLVLPLRQIREVSWTAMNSFVHAGLHPLSRTQGGFPEKLASDLLMNSNGMLHFAARLVARLTPSPSLVTEIEHSHLRFADCLPAPENT